MTLLPIIALATGLNMAAPFAPTVPAAQQAQVRVDQLIAAEEPALHAHSLESALHQDRIALQNSIASSPRNRHANRETDLAAQARAMLDRLVAQNESRLHSHAVNAAQVEGQLAFSRGLAMEINSAAIVEEVASGQNVPADRVSAP